MMKMKTSSFPADEHDKRRRSAEGQAFDTRTAVSRLAALLQMEERLRRAEIKELPFIVVNETRLLVPYRQAVLWQIYGADSFTPMAVSGLSVPEKNSPYLQWQARLIRNLKSKNNEAENQLASLPFTAADLPEDLKDDWAEWLPAYGLYLPLPDWKKCLPPGDKDAHGTPKTECFGVLTLFSQNQFSQGDLRALGHLSSAYGQALSLAFSKRCRQFSLSKKITAVSILAVLIFLLPIKMSVLAPAEVIAEAPWPVRSHLDGVVEKIVVEPNATVVEGELLLSLDTTELNTRLAVAAKSLDVARVELRQARQQALADREARLRLVYLTGRVEQLEAEKVYVENLLERAAIHSPIEGVALVDAPEEWAGKPVSLGQRIMTIAEPDRIKLEIFLPMDEYLPQKPGAEVLFFPNTSPGSPHSAYLYQVGFQAQETAQAGLAFKLRADFKPEQGNLRLGVRGRAKLYGKRAPLIYVLLRKPIMKLRQWIGI